MRAPRASLVPIPSTCNNLPMEPTQQYGCRSCPPMCTAAETRSLAMLPDAKKDRRQWMLTRRHIPQRWTCLPSLRRPATIWTILRSLSRAPIFAFPPGDPPGHRSRGADRSFANAVRRCLIRSAQASITPCRMSERLRQRCQTVGSRRNTRGGFCARLNEILCLPESAQLR